MMIEFDVELDASGLLCPLPLLRLKKALMTMTRGQVIKVIATDPAAHLDFGVYLEQAGHRLLSLQRDDDKQVFYIEKQ